MHQYGWMPERSPDSLMSTVMRHPRLSPLGDRSRPDDRQDSHPTHCRCIVDHLPPEMLEADILGLIGVASDVPITWFPGPGYVWCLVTVPEPDALAMEQHLDGLELDDHHTLRCEAMGARDSIYAAPGSDPASVASLQ